MSDRWLGSKENVHTRYTIDFMGCTRDIFYHHDSIVSKTVDKTYRRYIRGTRKKYLYTDTNTITQYSDQFNQQILNIAYSLYRELLTRYSKDILYALLIEYCRCYHVEVDTEMNDCSINTIVYIIEQLIISLHTTSKYRNHVKYGFKYFLRLKPYSYGNSHQSRSPRHDCLQELKELTDVEYGCFRRHKRFIFLKDLVIDYDAIRHHRQSNGWKDHTRVRKQYQRHTK